jgi:F420 biosynthesis protein FbiB-like protein
MLNSPTEKFWQYFDQLVAEHPVVIDRAAGSPHPRYPALIYPLDYGYLQGTNSGDGSGIDLWVGTKPGRGLDALLLTVDLGKADAEIKLLLGCTAEEQKTVAAFLNGDGLQTTLFSRNASNLDFLKSRRSVRRFSTEELPRGMIEKLLETAVRAPSAHNRQPWRFALLASSASRERLAQGMGDAFRRDLLEDGYTEETADLQAERSRKRIVQAPAAVLVCMDTSTLDSYPDASRQRAAYLMMVQSVAMAGENLLLAAHAMGLGAVWMCAPLFAQQSVLQALELPARWEPQGLVLAGNPAKIPEERERTSPVELMVTID